MCSRMRIALALGGGRGAYAALTEGSGPRRSIMEWLLTRRRNPGYVCPTGVELLRDASEGEWLRERMDDWTMRRAAIVRSVVPEGFEAYARIFHPARRETDGVAGEEVRWSELAALNGKVAHPGMQYHRLLGIDDPRERDDAPGLDPPHEGDLPEAICRALLDVLGEHTRTPGACVFAVWAGYGSFDERALRGVSQLELPAREYYLYRGGIEQALTFYDWEREVWTPQPPNIWWPEDRSWCVATEIDFMETYVGGDRACIERILAHPALEALPISPDARIDAGGDEVNG